MRAIRYPLTYEEKKIKRFRFICCLMILAHLLVIPVWVAFAQTPEVTVFEGDSIYNHITIRQKGLERCMIFGRYDGLRQTCMNIDHPDTPILEYPSMMFVGFLFKPESRKVCLVGLGGGYIPTVFQNHLPRVALHIVETDQMVYRLAMKYFGFTISSNQTLTIADGRQYLKRTEQLYDQIWIDAFNSDYIPAHMVTREFLLLAKARLTPSGVLVQNVHSSNRLYDAQVKTFRSVFSNVFVFKGESNFNAVIVAADHPEYEPPAFCQKTCRQRVGHIDLQKEGKKHDRNPTIREASVLTDDFNPANLLLHKN